MIKWLVEKFGWDSVGWIMLSATIMVAVAGIAATIAFGVMTVNVGLALSIPTIFVGGFGTLITGLSLSEKGYI